MLSTQNNNSFNSTNTNQHHHDLNENRILSDQQRLNDKTPSETAVTASRLDDDDIYAMLGDSDEENADNQNHLASDRVDHQDSNGNQESAQPSDRRADEDQANSQANDLVDNPTGRSPVVCSPVDHPVRIKQEPIDEPIDSPPGQQEAADDDALFEIIDGILLYSFKTEAELKKFTEEDEAQKAKLNKKELKTKYSNRRVSGKCTATYSTARRKSSTGLSKQQPSHNQSQDSAFISPELDDYLSKKFRSDRSRLSFDENATNNLSLGESFDSSFSSCRKSKGKPSKKSSPEIVSVNEAITELDDDERMDNDVAYRRCIRSVEKAYNSVQEKMQGKFEPIPLDFHRVRLALGALHQNFIGSSSPSSIHSSSAFESSPTNPELDLDRARSTILDLENIVKSENILFKVEPAEENNLKEIKQKQTQVVEPDDKQQQKKKNRNEEEGYDITRIISKHSKRDIRLPARFHESGILVGSQWILPDFDENKSRSNRKQSTNRKKSAGKSLRPDLANSSISSLERIETTSPAVPAAGQPESESFNMENLMSEDEDSTPSNEPSTAHNQPSNSLSSIGNLSANSAVSHHVDSMNNLSINSAIGDKLAKKRGILKKLWRELFYASNSKRRPFHMEKGFLPRVNKYEALREGCRAIENLQKQAKNRNYCETSLMNWQNKLRLALAKIERSNGSLSQEELNEIDKTLNNYRSNLIKVDQLLTEGKSFTADH